MSAHDATTLNFLPLLIHPHSISFSDLETLAGDRPRPPPSRWPSATIIFITPPPIDEAARLLNPYSDNPSGLPERTNEAASAYAKACIDVAKACGTAVVDVWTKMQEFTDWRNSCLSDGLHLTQSGNRIVFEEVVAKLKEADLCLEKLSIDLPLFSDIDPNDPLKAFEK